MMMTLGLGATMPGYASAATAPVSHTPMERCEALGKLRLQHTSIVSANIVPEKASETGVAGDVPGYRSFCRVVARVQSSAESDIGMEIWLPVDGWAGVFHGNGNGGFAGVLASGYSGMADGLRRGFATATTDTGTAPATPLEGEALIDKPRKWRDWARLSTHVMTVTGKAITKSFYGRQPDRSFYTGCSTGGQQGLIESLYYPEDYDGILVGAPVINRTWGHAAVLWDYAAAHRTPGSLLSTAKLKLLNKGAIAACWRQGHGLAGDRFVADPLSCTFDPGELQCKSTAADSCLTPSEVATARAFYSGPTSADGNASYFGWLPGSEMPDTFGWSFLQTPINDEPPFGALFKWVFGADWDWKSFDFDRDMPLVQQRLDPIVNDATRGSLDAFVKRGGKLIIYHGLADTLVAPSQSIAFYEKQDAQLGGTGNIQHNARLFLAPGMMHCGGGAGPDSFNATLGIPPRPPVDDAQHDIFSALIAWTDKGLPPDRIIATKYQTEDPSETLMQRPICAYPKKAIYKGVGSTRSAVNFSCE